MSNTEETIIKIMKAMHSEVPEFHVELKMIAGIPEHFFNEKILRAREYAAIVHDGQIYGNHPYTKHLEDTYKVFLEFIIEPVYGRDSRPAQKGVIDKYQDIACAIWLHDAIEDTSTTRDEIEEHFGTDVADMVDSVSGVGSNRMERLDSIARKLEDKPDAIIIKLCDRIANTRYSAACYYASNQPAGLFLMYVNEFPMFKEQLGGIYKDIGFIQKLWTYLESISKE